MYQVDAAGKETVLASGKAHKVATPTQQGGTIEWKIGEECGRFSAALDSHRTAAQRILALLEEHGLKADAVGHRFAHGGDAFQRSARVDGATLAALRRCLPLAPIHNPNTMQVIETCQEEQPGVPQVVVFDTTFHAHLPEAARRYALPAALADEKGFHRFGFHGLSYQYVTERTAAWLGRPVEDLCLILCHLGTGGSSVAAVRGGHSIDTSMGYSPLSGLVMSTRCGDLDPQIVLDLVQQGMTVEAIRDLLNHQSGLRGLSGFSSDLLEIIAAAEQGNAACRLAFDVYVQRLKLYVGGYFWELGGADALVFTDDVGVRAWQVREALCSGIEALGIRLDAAANRCVPPEGVTRISPEDAPVQILVMPTDEEAVILKEVIRLLIP